MEKVRGHTRSQKSRIFYHVTLARKVPSIQKKGLLASSKKNVRISKRGYNYVFSDLFEAGSFASQMEWNSEEPVVILKIKLNPSKVEEDTNTGAFGGWYQTKEDIQPSQILQVIPFDDNFIKEHKKRMDKIFKR